ncbi:hypothetical protein GCM10025794_00770 [Massilia kyonggiensis]
MNYTVNIADIEQALIGLGGEAKAKNIQDKILVDYCNNSVPENYQNERSFRQTIQRKMEDYCPQADGFDGLKKQAKFLRVGHGLYRLALGLSHDKKQSEGTSKSKKVSPVPAAYKVKLPAMRDWLVRVAQRGQPVTYGDVKAAFGLDRFSLVHALARLGRQSKELEEPILSAMVVNKVTGRCGPGFDAEFGVNDVDERKRLHKFWTEQTIQSPVPLVTADIEERMARFVSKEARPQQAAFRRRVFDACGGRCVISGCDLVETLDAAHKKGRDWRKHNAASDGYVMRKDLHALYDNNLLIIESDGTIKLHEAAKK